MFTIPTLVSCLLLPGIGFLTICALFARRRIRVSRQTKSWSGQIVGWISLLIFVVGIIELTAIAILSVVRANF